MTSKIKFERAVKWAYIMNWSGAAMSGLVMLLLARLLGPAEFGTVAMAMVYVAFIRMFVEQGMGAALIQRKDLEREHLDSAFWLMLGTSLVLMAASVLLSGWWARLNDLPQLGLVISVLSLCIPIQGLTVVQRAILQRDMDFKSLTVRTNLSYLAAGVASVGLAYAGFGVWALVTQELARATSSMLLLWSLSGWRPGWRFSSRAFKELFGFSSLNFAARMGVFADRQLDALLMGLFFGPIPVGLYRLADRFMQNVLVMMSDSLRLASFPHFSRLQDDHDKLRKSVLSAIRLGSGLTIPALAGVAAVSEPLMRLVGPQWAASAHVLKVLCVVGMLLSLTQFLVPLLQALGKPHYLAALTWCLTGLNAVALFGAARLLDQTPASWQALGVAGMRLLMAVCIGTPVLLYVLTHFCRISLGDFARSLVFPAMAALATAGSVFLFTASGLLANARPLTTLALNAMLGGVAGVLTLLMLDRQFRSMILKWVGDFF